MLKLLRLVSLKKTTAKKFFQWAMMPQNERLKAKKKRMKAKLKRLEERNVRIKVFGKLRHYMALWFGQWILYSWNRRNTNG
jgi:hypothetical protein